MSFVGGGDILDHQLEASGTYTIIVRDYSLSNAGTFNISFLKIPGTVSSETDPDGGPISSGQNRSGVVDVSSDLDAYRFYGKVGDRIIVTAVSVSGLLNTYIVLYPPGGGAAEAMSFVGGGDILDHQLEASGIYTIVVRDYNLLNTGDYNVTLLKIPGPVSSAGDRDGGVLRSSDTLYGTIHTTSDVDAYLFYGNEGERAIITSVTSSGDLNTYIVLYPPGGGAGEATSFVGGGDILDHQLESTGLYTIVIRDYGIENVGEYDVSLTKIPSTSPPGVYGMSPADGSTICSGPGVFQWDALAEATGYDLYFGQNVLEPLEPLAVDLTTPSFPFPAMEANTIYYWYVVAHTPQGDVQSPYIWFYVTLCEGDLTLVTPNGGETWGVGEAVEVEWANASGDAGTYVRVLLYAWGGTFEYWAARRTPNDGYFAFFVPPEAPASDFYRVRIQAYDDPGYRDASDDWFSITRPALLVTTPDRGDVWTTDEIATVQWESNDPGVGDYVRVGLHRGAEFWGWMALHTENDGAFAWIVPHDLPEASNYKVRVQSYDDNGVRDFSRKFSIERKPLVLTSPLRSEAWPAGTVQTVEWQSNDPAVGDYVRIWLHQGSACDWIVKKTENDGAYDLIVPDVAAASNYKIRVQSWQDNDLRDFSPRFRIHAAR
ncbi:MAG TPA: hypothetical protein ENN80_11780 [Candidatus Hydrogenedentes bacterium]|nr:hypothetical protein [Candidatus Hydrogenedentota bacterium]